MGKALQAGGWQGLCSQPPCDTLGLIWGSLLFWPVMALFLDRISSKYLSNRNSLSGKEDGSVGRACCASLGI